MRMSGYGVHDRLLSDLVAGEFPDFGTVSQHNYLLAIADDFLQF
jgi:hypothetical protein